MAEQWDLNRPEDRQKARAAGLAVPPEPLATEEADRAAQANVGDLGDNRDTLSEKAFFWKLVNFAESCGWTYYHVHFSQRSPEGFPDLILVRDTVIYVELKSDKGLVTKAQKAWLQILEEAGQECHVWRPQHWPEIVERLGRMCRELP